ncbi:MAG: hypothetical protein ACRDWG_12110 [Actinomycetes bacterium]
MNTTGEPGSVERAARAELATLTEPAASSALAAAVLVLARRLDASPGDAVASMLVRELRHAMAYLHRLGSESVGGEVERFLAGLSTADDGDTED